MKNADGTTRLRTWTVCVPSSPNRVADALREIAHRVERDRLVLISIYSTGFGEAHEAALQVVAEHDEDVAE